MSNKQGGVIKGEGGKYQKINKRPESKKKNFWQIGIHNGKNILLVFTDKHEFCKGSK